jgi:hypothetical protein
MTHRCSIVVQTCGVKVLPASFLKGLVALITLCVSAAGKETTKTEG